ncbi:MAG TPA: PAS domain S-box protein [Holophaga sp.]|nr:PAS domain S-box protein [Holophaga sp.]
MVQFNTRANEILLKLVYYGPGLSGKTTNLHSLHAMCNEGSRGEMFSVNTQEDRTLFFDLLPINLGYIYGNAIHLQIYTVPGQVQYDASRRVVLGGADGVVFVADSSEAKMQENVDSLSNLYHNLNANRLNIKQIPFVIQFNKRDLPDAMPVGVMNRRLNFRSVPFFEAIAPKGVGVLDTFLSITKDTVATTFRKYHLDKKIKDFDEMLNLIDTNIRSSMRELPTEDEPQVAPPVESTVLRHSQVSVSDLAPDKVADAQELLEDALKSNMETARLYSELKQVKESLEKKNDEMNQLYSQLERANQDNLKTRRYLEGLIQSVGEAIISFSHDGRILTWNAAAEAIFGYARSEILGHSMQQLAPPSRAGEMEQVISQVGKGVILREVATMRVRKSGQEFPALITYAPIRGGDDRVLAFSAMVRDVDAQKTLERRLENVESGTSMARILPALLNELTNRLTPILLQRGLLQEEVSDPTLALRFSKLFQAVDSAQMLMKPILMVLSSNTPRLEPQSLNALIQEAVKRLEGEAAASGVSIELSCDPSLPMIGLDPEQAREALVNLLRSAIYAATGSNTKRVRVGTRIGANALQVVSQDSGPAVPEAQWARIFDLSAVSNMETLGLCVAASVARAHGGSASMRSQEGAGNAILLEFPMTNAAPAPQSLSTLQGKRILAVDDEAFLLECLADAMGSWGADVTACSLGTEAIQKLQQESFDLIISDIRMPGLTGIQLFQWIQDNQPPMARRILYTTGDTFDPDTRDFLNQSSLPHLGKPFDLKKLKQSLTDLLAANS